MAIQKAKFSIGDIVKHKHFEFRGVIYDVDFEFNNSEEWYQSIPKNVRPRKDQLIFSRSNIFWNRLIPFLRIVKLEIYIINNTSKFEVLVFNNISN